MFNNNDFSIDMDFEDTFKSMDSVFRKRILASLGTTADPHTIMRTIENVERICQKKNIRKIEQMLDMELSTDFKQKLNNIFPHLEISSCNYLVDPEEAKIQIWIFGAIYQLDSTGQGMSAILTDMAVKINEAFEVAKKKRDLSEFDVCNYALMNKK